MRVAWRLLPVLAGLGLFAGAAHASPIVLDFEGVNATYPSSAPAQVLGFYNGGASSDGTSGTNFGIGFTDNALAICLNLPGILCSDTSRGGTGNPASARGGLFFLSGTGTFMNVPAGFDTGISFFYAAVNNPGSVSVYDGLGGTGSLLATLNLPTTPSGCDLSLHGADFCPFLPSGIGFSGTAQSVSFAGVADQVRFDDITLGATPGGLTPVPEPASLVLFGTGLSGIALAAWRRRKSRPPTAA